jgi:hypothetical protein
LQSGLGKSRSNFGRNEGEPGWNSRLRSPGAAFNARRGTEKELEEQRAEGLEATVPEFWFAFFTRG